MNVDPSVQIERRISKRDRTGWLALLALCMLGCSSGEAPVAVATVEGTVMYRGSPLPAGTITFQADSGFGASAEIGPDGGFSIATQHGSGLPLGEYRVSVFVLEPDDIDPLAPEDEKSKARTDIRLPQKYRDPGTSGLTASIGADANRLSFDLED